MPPTDHPYKSLESRAFWRTAVAEKNPFDISDLYRKKFEITPRDKISTAGSCFAQHIGRRLKASGFRYVDLEPGPSLLPRSIRSDFGYGVFSARYGNIYTTRQLLQLFLRAFGEFTPKNDVWTRNGRYYDAFRPTIEKGGFAGEEELLLARNHTFAMVRRIFSNSHVFVFTLGLTEAWVSRDDGSVYPVCPGVEAGSFDPDRHEFRNFTFNEISSDLQELMDRVKAINPGLRFLLTVSPVPLTATASGQHVLLATTHSKSVLRSVAGELAERDDFVDYFPSYEIITAAPMRSMFFDPNLRSVNPAGVDLVMRHFFQQHPPSGSVRPLRPAAPKTLTDEDVVCDEGKLEKWSIG
jgi:hypothetical protein